MGRSSRVHIDPPYEEFLLARISDPGIGSIDRHRMRECKAALPEGGPGAWSMKDRPIWAQRTGGRQTLLL
jgi:hypothetical protein